MTRRPSSGRSGFARFGLRPHHLRTNASYRGGLRR